MTEEFLQKLKESLQTLDTRLSAVEHIVNDVIIKGLSDAADAYQDDELYSDFVDNYKTTYEDLEKPCTILYGENYDLGSDLYETLKEKRNTEGFDEKVEVERILAEIRSKLGELAGAMKKEELPAEEDNLLDETRLRKVYRGE